MKGFTPRPTLTAVIALITVVLAVTVTYADPRRPSTARATRDHGRGNHQLASASCGYANRGRLDHGRLLRESTSVRYLPGRTAHYGTDELVGLLERTARRLNRRYRARLTVGDLSPRAGGPSARHRSHQSGLDADLAFFARRVTRRGVGAPVDANDYVSFDHRGRNADQTLEFDTERNWALVESLVTDPRTRAARLFISSPLRALLLHWARAHGAPPEAIERAANTLVQPARVSPHDNHLHVRIGCPSGDSACRDGVLPRRENTARHTQTRRPRSRRASR